MSDLIADAITSRRLVQFYYDGYPRVVIPAAYGTHATTLSQVLRGYQVRGSGKTRVPPFWSMFTIAKIERLAVLNETFEGLPPQYQRDDKQISPIFAQL